MTQVLLPLALVPTNEESGEHLSPLSNQTKMAPKLKSIQGDAFGSSTSTFANVIVVDIAPEPQDIPLVHLPLEKPQGQTSLDDEEVSKSLMDLRCLGKRKAPSILRKSSIAKNKGKKWLSLFVLLKHFWWTRLTL